MGSRPHRRPYFVFERQRRQEPPRQRIPGGRVESRDRVAPLKSIRNAGRYSRRCRSTGCRWCRDPLRSKSELRVHLQRDLLVNGQQERTGTAQEGEESKLCLATKSLLNLIRFRAAELGAQKI